MQHYKHENRLKIIKLNVNKHLTKLKEQFGKNVLRPRGHLTKLSDNEKQIKHEVDF